ncbi:MAG: uroporphyrinogen-III synthase, partial [Silvibacterium sp.]
GAGSGSASPGECAVTGSAPLAGKRILVTRTQHQAGQLSVELAKLGAEAIEIPAIEIASPASYEALDAALLGLRRYAWLIVTSANAVRVIRERCSLLNLTAEDFSHLKIAAVGATTARFLEKAGLSASITPKAYVAESLVESLADQARDARVLIVRAAVARDVISNALAEQGAQVDVVEAYRTVVPQSSVEKVAMLFAGKRPDAATFTSSSTVTNFFHMLHAAGHERQPGEMLAVSIGPITSQTLREHGWEPVSEAEPHDIAGLVAATVRALRGSS